MKDISLKQMEPINEVLRNIQSGNQDAFRQVIQKYGPMVRVYLSSHVRDFRDVEELTQEIFVAVYWNLNSYNPEYSFSTWIRTIARNKMRSYFRRQNSHKNSVNVLHAEIFENLPEPNLAPSHKTSSVMEQLSNCVGKLTGKTADLVQSRYFQRETVTNIAKKMNLSEDAISSRLYRIRKQLKDCIEGGIAS